MSGKVVELATIHLAKGKTEGDLISASDTFQREFLQQQAGFLRRELMRNEDGTYADLIHWRSMADAQAIMDKVAESPACQAYFSVMQVNPENPAEGVSHHDSLAVYD